MRAGICLVCSPTVKPEPQIAIPSLEDGLWDDEDSIVLF